jgi:hypothetical protein
MPKPHGAFRTNGDVCKGRFDPFGAPPKSPLFAVSPMGDQSTPAHDAAKPFANP